MKTKETPPFCFLKTSYKNVTFETMGHCPGVKCICSCTMATGALEVLLLVQLTNTGGSTGACC